MFIASSESAPPLRDKSLQQYMLDAVCRQADLASAEELLVRKRVEALAHGQADLDPQLIVDIIRADRESH